MGWVAASVGPGLASLAPVPTPAAPDPKAGPTPGNPQPTPEVDSAQSGTFSCRHPVLIVVASQPDSLISENMSITMAFWSQLATTAQRIP